jgi:hypothetical protein
MLVNLRLRLYNQAIIIVKEELEFCMDKSIFIYIFV